MIKRIVKEILLRPVLTCKERRAVGKVGITFDDGPNSIYTGKILNVLAREGAKATFFLVGRNIEKYPEIVEDIFNEGHEIANHSMSHPEFTELSYGEMAKEIEGVWNLLSSYRGPGREIEKRYFRPPKGIVNVSLLVYCLLRQKKIVLWSLDPEDFLAKSEDDIVSYFKAHPVESGDIILLHDKSPYTVLALKPLLEQIKRNGLVSVPLSRLLNA